MNNNGNFILGHLEALFEWVRGGMRLQKLFQGRNFEHLRAGMGCLDLGDTTLLIRRIDEFLTIGSGKDMFVTFI